jgi:predicted RNA-binding protein Jag
MEMIKLLLKKKKKKRKMIFTQTSEVVSSRAGRKTGESPSIHCLSSYTRECIHTVLQMLDVVHIKPNSISAFTTVFNA